MGSYWEAEPEANGEPFSVQIETTDDAPPSEAQVCFYQTIVADLDSAFRRAAPVLVREYEEWMNEPFPEQWRTAFKPAGMSVPLDGLAMNPWDLSFDCLTDRDGHQFTCYFEQGVPQHVSIDG
ncbi:MAG: hypothetical protein HY318_03630 [Armatimonadetes bacterium]|nr:hypothetical protein [Armatimonadota bacterium]